MKSKLCFGFFFLSLFFLVYEKGNAQAPGCLWAKSIGAIAGVDFGHSITVDDSDNVYTTGFFQGTVDFDPGTGVFNLTAPGLSEIFISKLDSMGNFVWAKAMGGNAGSGYSIVLDASGYIYTTGFFEDTADFDPGPGVFNLIAAGGYDIFISKLDNTGNFVWAKAMGGTGAYIEGYAIVLDASGNVYTTGRFRGTVDFDPDSSANFNLTYAGVYDIFISKLDNSGNFIWAKAIGDTNYYDTGKSIALDPAGNGVYTTGWFGETVDFDPGAGAFYLTAVGDVDIFISKLDSAGNFLWAKAMGGGFQDIPNSITVDHSGNGDVYTTGSFQDTCDFDPGAGTFNLSTAGPLVDNIFISKLDSSGNFVWAKAIGGISAVEGNSISLDPSGNVYTTGFFYSTADFDPDSSGIFNLTATGTGLKDIFALKLDNSGNFVWAKGMGGDITDNGLDLALDASGNVYLTGGFQSDSVYFDNFTLVNSDTICCVEDIFITKIGICSAHFTLYADTIPQNWIAVNQATGVAPLTYLWSWGDGNFSSGATPSHIYNTPGYYNICLIITDAAGCTSTYCDSSTYIFRGTSNSGIITINVVLPNTTNIIEQAANENGVFVYPNPAQDLIHINSTLNFPATQFILYDASGREVIEKKFNGSTSFSVKHLNAGIYFYKIRDVKGNEVLGKIIKQ